MTSKSRVEQNNVTLPRWLYDQMVKDSELVRHLAHYRGHGWIKAVREEMESDRKFGSGAFSPNKGYELQFPAKKQVSTKGWKGIG